MGRAVSAVAQHFPRALRVLVLHVPCALRALLPGAQRALVSHVPRALLASYPRRSCTPRVSRASLTSGV